MNIKTSEINDLAFFLTELMLNDSAWIDKVYRDDKNVTKELSTYFETIIRDYIQTVEEESFEAKNSRERQQYWDDREEK